MTLMRTGLPPNECMSSRRKAARSSRDDSCRTAPCAVGRDPSLRLRPFVETAEVVHVLGVLIRTNRDGTGDGRERYLHVQFSCCVERPRNTKTKTSKSVLEESELFVPF